MAYKRSVLIHGSLYPLRSIQAMHYYCIGTTTAWSEYKPACTALYTFTLTSSTVLEKIAVLIEVPSTEATIRTWNMCSLTHLHYTIYIVVVCLYLTELNIKSEFSVYS